MTLAAARPTERTLTEHQRMQTPDERAEQQCRINHDLGAYGNAQWIEHEDGRLEHLPLWIVSPHTRKASTTAEVRGQYGMSLAMEWAISRMIAE